MGNPVNPASVKAIVPAIQSKVCEALVKSLLAFPALFYRVYSWMFNADATPSNALKQGIIPPGFIMEAAIAADTVTDWLLCNGQSVSKETYPELYNAIGVVYGGDGAPNFMVPNLTDKFVVGTGENTLGATGGLKTVTLTEAQMPAHTHTISGKMQNPSSAPVAVVIDDDVLTDSTAQATSSTGGGEAHENRPPFIALKHFIKT